MSYPSDGHDPRAYPGDGAPRDFQRRRPPQGYQPRGGYQPQGGQPSQDGYGSRGGQPQGAYQPGAYPPQGGYAGGAHGGYDDYAGDAYRGQGRDGAGGRGYPEPGYQEPGYSGPAYGGASGVYGHRDSSTQVIDPYSGDGYDSLLPPEEGDEPSTPGKRRLKDKKARRKKIRKILLICLTVFVVLIAGGTFAGWRYLKSVEDKVTKVDAFEAIPEAERPAQVSTKAMNILILGTDSRNPDESGSRTDTIMVAHVTTDHKTSQIVSIPRDSWVKIPKSTDGKHGGQDGKINWAFAWGGIPLMVRTVESVTKVRIDHVVLIDFAGFKEIVDAVGGIDINNDVTFTSYFWENNHHVFQKGRLHLDGNLALDFARQRHDLAGGDFDRIKNQQKVVKAVLDKATSRGVMADPGKLTDFLNSVAKTITTDKGFDLLSTALTLRGISSSQVKFMTAPTKGTGRVGTQSVVFYDFDNATSLFDALKNDKAATWKKP